MRLLPYACCLAGLLAFSPLAVDRAWSQELDKKPSCTISGPETAVPPRAAGQTQISPEEPTRRTVFIETAKALDKARIETAAAYPRSKSTPLLAPSPAGKAQRYTSALRLTLLAAEARHVTEIQRRHGLECAQVREIYREGQLKKWPDS